MRRLPIYILIDTSGSMKGEPIEAVKVGLQALVSSLRRDPYALETAWLSIITYDREAKLLVPLTELDEFVVPEFATPTTSPTNLGEALELLASRYRNEVRQATLETKGDWAPILIIMTDGYPSDTQAYRRMVEALKSYRFGDKIACAVGSKAKIEPLRLIADRVYSLDTMDASSFSLFWRWVSMALGTASRRTISLTGEDVSTDAVDQKDLPPPPPEIKLVL